MHTLIHIQNYDGNLPFVTLEEHDDDVIKDRYKLGINISYRMLKKSYSTMYIDILILIITMMH